MKSEPRPISRTLRNKIELFRAYAQEQVISATDEGEDIIELLPGHLRCPDDLAHSEHIAELLRRLLQRLTPSARDALIARFGLDGHPPRTPAEIAAARGVSSGAIEQQWLRSKRHLLTALRAAGVTGAGDI